MSQLNKSETDPIPEKRANLSPEALDSSNIVTSSSMANSIVAAQTNQLDLQNLNSLVLPTLQPLNERLVNTVTSERNDLSPTTLASFAANQVFSNHHNFSREKATRGKPVEEAFPQSLVNRSLIPKYLIDEAYQKEGDGLVYKCLLENCNKVFKSTTGRLITNYQLRLHINNYHSRWLLHKKGLPLSASNDPKSSLQIQHYIEQITQQQLAEKKNENSLNNLSLVNCGSNVHTNSNSNPIISAYRAFWNR